MKFYIGEKVNVTGEGKYKGQNVFIKEIHVGFNPVLYSCEALNGCMIALYETEIQSIYQHDMEMLTIWNSNKGGS
jgi:hypothetical protein